MFRLSPSWTNEGKLKGVRNSQKVHFGWPLVLAGFLFLSFLSGCDGLEKNFAKYTNHFVEHRQLYYEISLRMVELGKTANLQSIWGFKKAPEVIFNNAQGRVELPLAFDRIEKIHHPKIIRILELLRELECSGVSVSENSTIVDISKVGIWGYIKQVSPQYPNVEYRVIPGEKYWYVYGI